MRLNFLKLRHLEQPVLNRRCSSYSHKTASFPSTVKSFALPSFSPVNSTKSSISTVNHLGPSRSKPSGSDAKYSTMPNTNGNKQQPTDHLAKSRTPDANEKNDDWRSKPPYRTAAKNEHFDKIWTAHCSCERVKYWLSREKPLASKYCHCRDCQSLHGAPFQWAAVFHKEDLHFEKGAEGLAFYNTADKQTHHKLPCKVSCSYCHTPIMDEGRKMVLMFPGIIKVEDPEHKKWFEPQCHIFYKQRIVDISDGKPKWTGLDDDSELMDDVPHHEIEAVVGRDKVES